MTDIRLGRRQIYALIGVLAALIAPHAWRMPPWLWAAIAGLFVWRIWLTHSQRRMPPVWLLWPVVFGLIIATFLSYQSLFGRSTGVAVLSVLIAAKLLETRTLRDALLLMFLLYFLVTTNLLFDQSVYMATYLLLMVLLATGLLISWHTQSGLGGRRQVLGQLRLSATIMLQALPLMLLLFVFFPRLDGPLWRAPQEHTAASSGLSESMSPGSFSKMAQNPDVAFRVLFSASHQPSQALLYWRGPVFETYDGRTWRQSPENNATALTVTALAPSVHYALTLEPHQQSWLLGLDMPLTPPTDARIDHRMQLISPQPVEKRRRYEADAALLYRAGLDENPQRLANDVRLPADVNPRARALAHQWLNLPPAERINAALRLFSRQGLQYTLTPPLYGRNAVDDFLFVGHQGFCEHFAGSFVFLMRAAGVPARVVAGYQGGETNGGYLIVRQADAHAWTEVWLAGQGWVRVDPTFAVAPERIEHGLASALPSADLPYLLRMDNNWVKQIRLAMDSFVNNWNQWVIGYTPERQRELLKRLGIDDLASTRFLLWFGGSLAAALASVAGWLLWRMRPAPEDPLHRIWRRFCHKLGRTGITPGVAEGPADFARRAVAHLPARAADIQRVLTLYIEVRYGSQAKLAELKRAISDF